MWPQADIFTAVYDEDGTEGRFAHRSVHSSFLQRLRPSARTFRALLPLYPAAIESFDLSGYELVVSSSSAWAHAVLCDEHTVHVSYCHNPFRYAWNDRERTLARSSNPLSSSAAAQARSGAGGSGTGSRRSGPTATSPTRAPRRPGSALTSAANRTSSTRRSTPSGSFPVPVGEHYALVSELMPHKQIDDAIDAFNTLQLPLIVVGDGPDARQAAQSGRTDDRFTGRLPDASVSEILRGARALVVTAIEEFGIAAVESQAAGRPVIARQGRRCARDDRRRPHRLLLVRRVEGADRRDRQTSTTPQSTRRLARAMRRDSTKRASARAWSRRSMRPSPPPRGPR